MARSDEQRIHDLIVTEMLFWRKHGGGKLLHDRRCATNEGKYIKVEEWLAELQEIRDRKLALKKE